MEKKKRQYTQEFKKEAVEYSLSSEKTTEPTQSKSLAQRISQMWRAVLSRPWQGKPDSSGGRKQKAQKRAYRYPDRA